MDSDVLKVLGIKYHYFHLFKVLENPLYPCNNGNQTIDHLIYDCTLILNRSETLQTKIERTGQWLTTKHKLTAHSPNFPSLHLRHSSFSNLSLTSPTSQLILQPFPHFTYVTAHFPTFPSLYLGHSSFSNLSVIPPTSQLILQSFRHFTYVTTILQPFRRFTYVTAHSPTLPLLHLRHTSFSNPSFASPTLQALHLIHIASSAHSPTFPSLHLLHNYSPTLPSLYLRHSSFSNPSVASPTSQFVLQPFFRFSYVTSSSLNSHGEPPMSCAYKESGR